MSFKSFKIASDVQLIKIKHIMFVLAIKKPESVCISSKGSTVPLSSVCVLPVRCLM